MVDMQPLPQLIVWAHVIFNATVIVGSGLGLVYIWHPFDSVVLQKVFGSTLVLLAASTLLLAGYRTVRQSRGEA
jgi:hypothetical protein